MNNCYGVRIRLAEFRLCPGQHCARWGLTLGARL